MPLKYARLSRNFVGALAGEGTPRSNPPGVFSHLVAFNKLKEMCVEIRRGGRKSTCLLFLLTKLIRYKLVVQTLDRNLIHTHFTLTPWRESSNQLFILFILFEFRNFPEHFSPLSYFIYIFFPLSLLPFLFFDESSSLFFLRFQLAFIQQGCQVGFISV